VRGVWAGLVERSCKGSYFHETAGNRYREGGSSHLVDHAFIKKYQELRESRKFIFQYIKALESRNMI
jgi:hypothetical protein